MNYYFITLNIGLNNNPLDFTGTVKKCMEIIELMSSYDGTSEYLGQEEPTAVVSGYIKTESLKSINSTVQDLCVDLTQQSIAYKVEGIGNIAFNPTMDVPKFDFDQQYFID
jgi:uncharacterized protein (DUF2235 family)